MRLAARVLPFVLTSLIALGVALILGGVLGFLPILGLWMLPLGLIVLSTDFAQVRRLRRRLDLWFGRTVTPAWHRFRARMGGRRQPR